MARPYAKAPQPLNARAPIRPIAQDLCLDAACLWLCGEPVWLALFVMALRPALGCLIRPEPEYAPCAARAVCGGTFQSGGWRPQAHHPMRLQFACPVSEGGTAIALLRNGAPS